MNHQIHRAILPSFPFALAFSLLVALACVAGAPLAMAQQFDRNLVKRVPSYLNEMSEADFLSKSQIIQETPLKDKNLSYQIRLPTGWNKTEDGGERESGAQGRLDSRVLGVVAQYYGPTRIDAVDRLRIEAMNLDYELSVRNWFLNYIFSRGYTLQGIEQLPDESVEAQYVTLQGDTAYIFRVRAIANGPRIVLISYAVPEHYWEKERALQEHVIKSFFFTNPEDSVSEHTRTYSFLDFLRFDYPAGWRLIAPNIYSDEAMDAKIVSSMDSKTVAGEIDIRIISTELDTSLADEVKYLKEDIGERGLKVGEMIEVGGGYKLGDHIRYNRVEIYKINDDGQKIVDHELWLAIMVEDRYYYIVTMITPGRDSDFYVWAKNNESFETVIESLRP